MEVSVLLWKPIIAAALLLVLVVGQFTSANSNSNSNSSKSKSFNSFINQCCSTTAYPQLCYDSLARYAADIQNNPTILVTKAFSVAVSSAKSTSLAVKKLSGSPDLTHREAGAVADCVGLIANSAHQLQLSIKELGRDLTGHRINFTTKSDIQTWVSAALTDGYTCMDGFDHKNKRARARDRDDGVWRSIGGKILKVAHLTRNALTLLNKFVSTTTKAQLN
ncbi:hypothetical protein Dimus_008886 [Dionaea muscipula]